MDFTEDTATEAVVASFESTTDPRLREILEATTRHLHELVRELRPTQEELAAALGFLTDVGHACTETRQEFVLLSDVLGVSMLVETINGDPHGTETTVLGPFHMTESPVRGLGDSIDLLGRGTPCVVSGQVTDEEGVPIAGATVDVWQCNEEGFYDVQQPDVQPAGNGRGLFTTDADGGFRFRTVVPSHYPIPTDGPVGALLHATGRHPYRPAHIHFIVGAEGFKPLTTHAFVAGSPYLDSDAVFAVKQSLVVDFDVAGSDVPEEGGTDEGLRRARFDIRLAADLSEPGYAGAR